MLEVLRKQLAEAKKYSDLIHGSYEQLHGSGWWPFLERWEDFIVETWMFTTQDNHDLFPTVSAHGIASQRSPESVLEALQGYKTTRHQKGTLSYLFL